MPIPTLSDGVEVNIAVVGAGLIGQSFGALFLANGFKVRFTDTREDLEDVVKQHVPGYLAQAANVSLEEAEQVVAERVTCTHDVAEAVTGAYAVQEAGPERVEIKHAIWDQVIAAAPQDALLLSSSSSIPASAQHERVIIGHPFNPPHIMPLIEVVPSPDTPEEEVSRVLQFYHAIGKRPVRLKKEKPGFVANRLQAVVLAEAMSLVAEGVIDAAHLDNAMTASLGVRWAAVGPLLGMHLGGGDAGLEGLLKHIGAPLLKLVNREDVLDDETVAAVVKSVKDAYPGPAEDFARDRDAIQEKVIEAQLKVWNS